MKRGAAPQWERRKRAMARKYYRVDGGGRREGKPGAGVAHAAAGRLGAGTYTTGR